MERKSQLLFLFLFPEDYYNLLFTASLVSQSLRPHLGPQCSFHCFPTFYRQMNRLTVEITSRLVDQNCSPKDSTVVVLEYLSITCLPFSIENNAERQGVVERCSFEQGLCFWEKSEVDTAAVGWTHHRGQEAWPKHGPPRDHTYNSDAGIEPSWWRGRRV